MFEAPPQQPAAAPRVVEQRVAEVAQQPEVEAQRPPKAVPRSLLSTALL